MMGGWTTSPEKQDWQQKKEKKNMRETRIRIVFGVRAYIQSTQTSVLMIVFIPPFFCKFSCDSCVQLQHSHRLIRVNDVVVVVSDHSALCSPFLYNIIHAHHKPSSSSSSSSSSSFGSSFSVLFHPPLLLLQPRLVV